jgi:uncharacterized membrane protein YqjE
MNYMALTFMIMWLILGTYDLCALISDHEVLKASGMVFTIFLIMFIIEYFAYTAFIYI